MPELHPGLWADLHALLSRMRDSALTDVELTDNVLNVIGNHHLTPASEQEAAIARVAPAEWPPRPGDLWRDREGDVWFVSFTGAPYMEMRRPDGLHGSVSNVTANHGPLTFVYRETPEAES